jgi:hypothetical protein
MSGFLRIHLKSSEDAPDAIGERYEVGRGVRGAVYAGGDENWKSWPWLEVDGSDWESESEMTVESEEKESEVRGSSATAIRLVS